MGLKFKIAKLDEVGEAVRGLYKPEGDGFVLDADGVVPKERLDEFRNNNITLTQQLEKLKDIDPVKYRELAAIQRKIDEKQLIEAGKLEEVVNLRVGEMKTTYETQIEQLNLTNQQNSSQLAILLIDNAVKSAALKNGVEPTAVDDVVLRARSIYSVDKGNPVPKNEKGEVIYGKDGSTPMPMEEWITGLKKSAPHLFQGSRGSGAGGGRGTGSVDMSKMTPAQKIAFGLTQGGVNAPQGL
jgi:hypothetical protein